MKIKCGTRGCSTLTVEMPKPLTEEQSTEDSDVFLDIEKVLGKKKKRKDKVLSLRLKQTILDIFWL